MLQDELDSGWDDNQSISGVSLSPSVMGFLATGKKISDAVTFGPRFCELFHNFTSDCDLQIEKTHHLYSLILDNCVDFLRWVRRDDHTIAEVNNLLFNSNYLRPETRNGAIMILIYLFSSIKASICPGLDMFSVLVSDDDGLGIANRFSLKIYNDPFGYLAFLKSSVSALIDCHVIPENDRMNTVSRSSKGKIEDATELEHFNKIKADIVAALTVKNHSEARRIVQVVLDFWQGNKREVSH
jgi:hypothetical protein